MIRANLLVLFAAAVIATGAAAPAASQQDHVLSYHGGPERSGNFVVPGLTWERARSVHLDAKFNARVSGKVYAQPLYWGAPDLSSGLLVIATEENKVYGLDAITGNEIWSRSLGKPVARSSLRCGNIEPLGITGTPVIEESTGSIYLDAAVEDSSGPRHRLFALSLKDGSPVTGWPVDVADALRAERFNPRDQNERGALTIAGGKLYVPFGGHYGDCGDYHGFVVSVSLRDPGNVASWSTRGRGGGIWAPGGISASAQSLFIATGNTIGASTWSDGEAVIRLAPDLHRSSDKRDFFAPTDWRALDARDADLGGTNPLPLDVTGPYGRQALILALGKDGRGYLMDRDNLGGIGGNIALETVSKRPIRTAPAFFPVAGDAFVAVQASGAECPVRVADSGLTVLKISAGMPPSMTTAWCGSVQGAGAPIVTTSDGRSDPIVWMVGAEGDERLHAFKGDTGEPLLPGGAGVRMTGLEHFQTLIAAKNRLYVSAEGRVFAFAF
ncbi:MAG TPA: hypothetical protein VIY51_14950 [Xanthobacteraceae bacterium]